MAEPTHLSETVQKDKIKLPMWQWILVGTVVVAGGYLWYRRRQSASAAAQQASATTPTTPTGSQQYVDTTAILPMFQGSSLDVTPASTQQPWPQGTMSTYTTTKPSYIQDVVDAVYYGGHYAGYPDPVRDQESEAIEGIYIINSNPQINWGQQLAPGTKVNIPPAVGAIPYNPNGGT